MTDVFENPKSIFSTLTPEEKADVRAHLTFTYFQKDEFLFTEGDKPSGFLFLIEGSVIVLKEGFSGREQIIRMVNPLGLICYRALLAGELHIASAIANEDSTVCSVTSEYLLQKLLTNSDFSLRLLQVLARELGFSNSRTITLTQKHIRGRLAESIILMKEKYGYENDGSTLKVCLSRDEIASLSNMTNSNAIRTLTTFAAERVIALDGRKIRILDILKLEKISRQG